MNKRFLLCLVVGIWVVSGCRTGDVSKDNPEPKEEVPKSSPMSHTFTTNGWETLDHLLGINEPSRYIWVQDRGFKIRKRIAKFFGGAPEDTPACVNYGGMQALFATTIEAKGKTEQIISYVQGEGDCQ